MVDRFSFPRPESSKMKNLIVLKHNLGFLTTGIANEEFGGFAVHTNNVTFLDQRFIFTFIHFLKNVSRSCNFPFTITKIKFLSFILLSHQKCQQILTAQSNQSCIKFSYVFTKIFLQFFRIQQNLYFFYQISFLRSLFHSIPFQQFDLIQHLDRIQLKILHS